MDHSPQRTRSNVAIVTGGARGIGFGIGTCLAAAGYRVALWDRHGEGAERDEHGVIPGMAGKKEQ